MDEVWVHLHPAVRLEDVAKVVGILVGHEIRPISEDGKGVVFRVGGVQVTPSDSPEFAFIETRVGKVLWVHQIANDGSRGFYQDSTPLWCAVARAVVDFFGGKMFLQEDEPEVEVPYRFEVAPVDVSPEWADLQRDIAALEPLSPDEIREMVEKAYFSDEDTLKEDLKSVGFYIVGS